MYSQTLLLPAGSFLIGKIVLDRYIPLQTEIFARWLYSIMAISRPANWRAGRSRCIGCNNRQRRAPRPAGRDWGDFSGMGSRRVRLPAWTSRAAEAGRA